MDFNEAHAMLLELRTELERRGLFPDSYINPFTAIVNRVERLAGKQLLEQKRLEKERS